MKKTIYGFALSVWSGFHYFLKSCKVYTTKEERDKEMKKYLYNADYLVETFEQELDL